MGKRMLAKRNKRNVWIRDASGKGNTGAERYLHACYNMYLGMDYQRVGFSV